MKRTTLLLKSLLLAVGLLAGSNVWADDVTFTQVASYNFDADGAVDPFENKTWSNRQTSTLEDDAVLGTKAVVFKGANLAGKTSGYHTLDFSTLTASSSQVRVEFDFYVNEANINRFALRDATIAAEPTKDVWTGTGAIFSIGCARVKESGVNVNRFGYNGVAISGAAFATPYHVSITVDVVNKKVSYSLTKKSDNSVVASGADIAFASSAATACTQLDFHGATNGTMAAINNIVISEYTNSSATTYSVEKYDTNGNLISTTSGLAAVAGETSSVSDADKADFYSTDSNTKYVYNSTDERNITSMNMTSTASSNVLKLYFTAYQKYTATISSVCGSNEVADITGSWYADESPVTLYWPKAVSTSEGFYVADAENTTPYYGHTFSTSDLTKTVTYTLDESIVYYAEYENILTNKNSYEYFSAQSSKGASRCIQKTGVMKTAMGLTSVGVYDVIIAGGNRDGSHVSTLNLKLIASDNTVSEDNVLTKTFTSNQWGGEMTAEKVTIPAGSELYIANDNGEGNARFAGDYIIVRKSAVPVTISSAGWATLYTPYALDFAETGLTAYTATLDGSNVELTEVTNVPANTGVVLMGKESSYNIPVIASSETAKGDLKGNATEATACDADYSRYYLAMNAENKAQFKKLIDDGTIAAGKAYLEIANAASAGTARTLNVVFAGETTAIDAIANVKEQNGEVYNLAGQRVAKPAKGLYIVSGKKVIIK